MYHHGHSLLLNCPKSVFCHDIVGVDNVTLTLIMKLTYQTQHSQCTLKITRNVVLDVLTSSIYYTARAEPYPPLPPFPVATGVGGSETRAVDWHGGSLGMVIDDACIVLAVPSWGAVLTSWRPPYS